MQAIIPIAGEGKRMEKRHAGPKQLIPVAGKPLIEHTLDNLPSRVDALVFIVGGPHENAIREYFGAEHGGRSVAYVEQKEQQGLGHAIQQAKGVVKGKFIQFTPDDIFGAEDLDALIQVPDLGVMAYRVRDPSQFGVLVTDDAGMVVNAMEKPETFVSDLAFTGASFLDEEFFDITVPPSVRGEIELVDIIMALVRQRGRSLTAVEASFWLPVNDPEQLSDAQKEMLHRLDTHKH